MPFSAMLYRYGSTVSVNMADSNTEIEEAQSKFSLKMLKC